MDVSIVVCTHKIAYTPESDMLKPIFVGKKGKNVNLPLYFMQDDIGDNMSNLNHSYCELTGLYWAWKHMSSKYIGLCHYRRYFSFRHKNLFQLYWNQLIHYCGHIYYALKSVPKVGFFLPYQYIVTDKDELDARIMEFEKDLECWISTHHDCELIALKPSDNGSMSNYYKFASFSGNHHLEIIRSILEVSYPEILPFYNKTLMSNKLYYANMIIMKNNLFNTYCNYLFSILDKYNIIMIKDGYYQNDSEKSISRISGYMGELLTSAFVSYYMNNNKKKCKLLYQIQFNPQ